MVAIEHLDLRRTTGSLERFGQHGLFLGRLVIVVLPDGNEEARPRLADQRVRAQRIALANQPAAVRTRDGTAAAVQKVKGPPMQ